MMRIALLPAVAGALVAAATIEPVSFGRDIQPLLDANCVACHQEEAPQQGLMLESGRSLAMMVSRPSEQNGMPIVAPGSPAQSYLMHKLLPPGPNVVRKGDRMPLGGNLSPAEIALFERWISEGAKDN